MKLMILIIWLSVLSGTAFSQSFGYDELPVYQNDRQILNPWNGGLIFASVALPDFDSDGDADLFVVGNGEGRIYYYTNDARGVDGQFAPVNLKLGQFEFPNQWLHLAIHDFDADGHADLFLGHPSGKIDYYHNSGTSTHNPEFTLESTYFDAIDVGMIAAPVFADLNADGRDDLLVGDYETGIFYYQRQAAGPKAFTLVGTLRDNLGQVIQREYGAYTPAVADLDADGDLDLLLGSSRAGLAFYRNTGSPTTPEFTLENNDFLIPPDNSTNLTPVLVDIDNDGDSDLFSGNENGQVLYYRNAGTPASPDFQRVLAQVPLDYLDMGGYAVPGLVDLDNDQDLDFFVNDEVGHLYRIQNTGTTREPVFVRDADPLVTLTNTLTASHTWADLDADTDFDFFFGVWVGGYRRILAFRNNGTPESAALDSLGWLIDGNGDTIEASRFDFTDMDGDHDLDLLVNVWTAGRQKNAILLYRNHGTPEVAKFVPGDTLRDASGLAISDYDFYFDFVDFDLDADPDLCLGNSDGRMIYFENVGTPEIAQFQMVNTVFEVVENGSSNRCIPALGDVDGDTDLDLIVGRMHGGFFFYRNLHKTDGGTYTQNIAPGKIASASRVFETHVPGLAIDNDPETTWLAGEPPPQWLEIDLLAPSAIGRIELIVDQNPAGPTVHRLWVRGAVTDSYRLIQEFRGITANYGSLTHVPYSPLEAIQFLKIETLESPARVGWREIRVFGQFSETRVNRDDAGGQPLVFRLQPNYPNPFNPETHIRYQLPASSEVQLVIFNALGQAVRTLVAESQPAGAHSVIWNGRDDAGRAVGAGIYLCRLQAGSQVRTQRMVLLK